MWQLKTDPPSFKPSANKDHTNTYTLWWMEECKNYTDELPEYLQMVLVYADYSTKQPNYMEGTYSIPQAVFSHAN